MQQRQKVSSRQILNCHADSRARENSAIWLNSRPQVAEPHRQSIHLWKESLQTTNQPVWHENSYSPEGQVTNSPIPRGSTSVCESTRGTGNWSTVRTKTMENNRGKQRLAQGLIESRISRQNKRDKIRISTYVQSRTPASTLDTSLSSSPRIR